MKIFYGVQGTGNGHITRARMMAREFDAAGIDVVYQFSGRPSSNYFEMEVFKDYRVRNGLSFHARDGEVSYLKTALETKPLTFIREVRALDLTGFDLIISDFEPVTSWAAKIQKKRVLGIGHQYAFAHKIPRAGTDPVAELLMKYFAPADIGLGLHWHHFGQPILPPIIDTPKKPDTIVENKIIVYLPFEDQNDVVRILSSFTNFDFHLFTSASVDHPYRHITCHSLSRDRFQKALYDAAGVISNAGFELASEALHLGKKILVKPLHSQMEQHSNAEALRLLGYGQVMDDIDEALIGRWLHIQTGVQVSYPNTARYLVQWIRDGMPKIEAETIEKIWSTVTVRRSCEKDGCPTTARGQDDISKAAVASE
ncbi:MAG: MJ1255/VC2487 family glycosyltransferase [Gammaproteobacteria bacterium]